MNNALRSKLIDKMKSADFYPHEVDLVKHRQTHISDVFPAGDLVYKLKKPVDTGFLDFTTQEKRQRFCKREVDHNRRLTSDIYLSVEDITYDEEIYSLAGSGDIVDYVVKMRRLNDADNLQSMLQENRAEEEFLVRLTDFLVNFYRHSKSSVQTELGGDVDQILANCRENFSALRSSVESSVDAERIAELFVITRIRSDQIRKTTFRHKGEKDRHCFGAGMYSATTTSQVYAKILFEAQDEL